VIGLPIVTSLVRLAPRRSTLSVRAPGVKIVAVWDGRPCVIRVRSEFVALNDGVHESQSVRLTVGVVSDSVGSVMEMRPPNVS
jgi:hypothetical protein